MSRNRRQADHAAGVQYAARQLRARGCRVEVVTVAWGVSLLVTPPNGRQLEIAVRACRSREAAHPVTVAGKRYLYRYRQLHWNLHCHGERRTAPDAWVLVALGGRTRAFVVPPELAPGKSVMLLDTEAVKPRRSRIRPCLGRWETITGAGKRKAA